MLTSLSLYTQLSQDGAEGDFCLSSSAPARNRVNHIPSQDGYNLFSCALLSDMADAKIKVSMSAPCSDYRSAEVRVP